MVTVHVTVYETRISQAFQRGGMIYNEANRLRRVNELIAAVKTPTRTGRLRASVGSEMLASGVFTCSYAVFAGADYAPYVLGGTTGPIRSNRPGGMMLVRPAPSSWYPLPTYRRSVRGQSANNFLKDSLFPTFALKGLIR